MDDSVVASMARWPDVPDIYGWLSLSEQGQWRMHPDGGSWRPGQMCPQPLPSGEPIESAQIRQFINRNYGCDASGRWYFQNGPQRVFIRLDAAPYILLTGSDASTLHTHNGLKAEHVNAWWLDDQGRLYAETEHGPGLISGRDAPAVFDALHTSAGEPLLTLLKSLEPADLPARPDLLLCLQATSSTMPGGAAAAAPLRFCPASGLPRQLGFVPCPAP
ncbi:DUF2946 family protein [Pusillimonas noertemannii]|uniref:DUF2946 family protein n=1 Tax=Pusillimonas noertemannii TaxID=305977 RepID=UPI0003673785|nr:DUF2946 family protein [Pusillimonas noertemannii]